MRSIAIAALIGLSQAVPALVERDPKWVTVTVYEDIFTTVTAQPVASSPASGFKFANIFGGKHRKHSSSVEAQVTPTPQPAPQPAQPVPQPAPVAEPNPAPVKAPVEAPKPQPAPSQAAPQPAPVNQAPAPAPVQAAPAAPAAPASNAYSDVVIYHHNVHRNNHSAPDMTWSPSLAATALKIAQSCSYAHNTQMDGGGYGQNIAAGAPVNSINTVITEQFYNGEVSKFTKYGQATPSDFDAKFESYGHFTQVVWVGSKQVGCASYDCSKTGLKNVNGNVPPIFHVCNYGPAGNYMGEFGSNVLPSKNLATVH